MINTIKNVYHDQWSGVRGSCGFEALSWMFNVEKDLMVWIAEQVKIDWDNNGLTKSQCEKLIKVLCQIRKKKYKYISAYNKEDLEGFIDRRRFGTFIVNLDEHLCCYKDEKFIDNWRPNDYSFIGAWEIADARKEFVTPIPSISMDQCYFLQENYTVNISDAVYFNERTDYENWLAFLKEY